tara:strand:+ start:3140 stop:3364 length:225 start_codon:yes stop_codon:yes gene_type:complete
MLSSLNTNNSSFKVKTLNLPLINLLLNQLSRLNLNLDGIPTALFSFVIAPVIELKIDLFNFLYIGDDLKIKNYE